VGKAGRVERSTPDTSDTPLISLSPRAEPGPWSRRRAGRTIYRITLS